MRPFLLVLAAGVVFLPAARAADLRNFEDAALHAVQFVDRHEGWAVGDEGVVWHTFDGGRNWERQPTGTRAALRGLHFLTPYTGWVAGREELAHGAGSLGVLLVTRDGGLKWQRVAVDRLPGLEGVRFLDDRTGFVFGEGTEDFPGGLFSTNDSGRTWAPVRGPRGAAWLAGDFQDGKTGVLAGAWGRLMTLRGGTLVAADVDPPGGRSVRGVRLAGKSAVAVGQGGLILVSPDSAGATWSYADLKLPVEVLSCWDFHAVHGAGDHVWVAGRPGSVLLHSPDRGTTWERLTTGQPLPLDGLFFLDEQHGWAVGEFGSILATQDGGQTWRVQHRGAQRSAVLFLHARSGGMPLDSVARLGGEDGYLAAAIRVTSPDPASAPAREASEPRRLAAAVRQVGGGAGEVFWQFPLAEHLTSADRDALLRAWDRQHGGRAAEQVLRQLVLALRVWRPSVVVTDHPDARVAGCPAEALVAEAVHEAFTRAADPNCFPEQLGRLALEPWEVTKLYARWHDHAGAQVVEDLTEALPRLQATPRDFAAPAAGMLAGEPVVLPTQRFYHLLASRLDGASGHRDLMQGIALTPGGMARRAQDLTAALTPEAEKAIRSRRTLDALAGATDNGLADPSRTLALLGPALAGLPEDQAAAAAFAVANQYARKGQWPLAREAFQLLAERYPGHPLAADACRWLVRHDTSSEARRRHELGQYLLATRSSPHQGSTSVAQANAVIHGGAEMRQEHELALLGSQAEARAWYKGALDVGARLEALGPVRAADPAVQFCLQAARRNLGEFDTTRQWYSKYRAEHADGPWRDAAAAEVWLANRSGPPGKPVTYCRQADARPVLDGKLDDACWEGGKPIVLKNVVGDTTAEYATEARLAYDKEFLYVALRCRHPADRHVAPVKSRGHDADLEPFDRVSLLIDLDRDYASYFHLQIDQRGCVRDECCLGSDCRDASWNPRWFVAVHGDATGWQAEAAVPLAELTGEPVTIGRAWAFNVVRTLPGQGVQAWSTPAGVQPRPEGMGLLLFTRDPAEGKKPASPARKSP